MSRVTPTRKEGFSWSAAFVGGAVTVGCGAFFGTFSATLSVYLSMVSGSTPDQAYAAMATNYTSVLAMLSIVGGVLWGVVGGYVASKFEGTRAFGQAAVASIFPVLFALVMYVAPSSQPGPTWFVIYSFVSPLIASLFGGLLYAKRS